MEKLKCPYCDKVIEGTDSKQAETNLSIHKLFKHPDKIEIKEKKK